MNSELDRLAAEALKLSVEDRERLVEGLIRSLDRDRDPAHGKFGGFDSAEIQNYWLDEAERRMQWVREGRMKTYPAEEVLANVRAQLASRAARLGGRG